MNECNIIEYPGKKPRVHATAYIDPRARILGDVTLNEKVVVLYGAVIRGDDDKVIIGRKSVLLEHTLVEAPSKNPVTIGEHTLISHGAIVHGATVGSYSLVGIGAIILNGARIGHESIVAAGALVPPGKVIPDRTIVAGIPAKPIRKVTENDLVTIKEELESVHKKAEIYRKILPRIC